MINVNQIGENKCILSNTKKNSVIKGNVYYDDGEPLENAIVIIEKYKKSFRCYEVVGHTLTDKNGSFIVRIYDIDSKHRITVYESNLYK